VPFDLSDDSGSNKPISLDPVGNLPTGRPSDILRPAGPGGLRPGTPGYGGGGHKAPESNFLTDRPITPADGAVRTIFGFALIALMISLGYLLWGIWSGDLANPHYKQAYTPEDHVRILSNLGMFESVLRISILVTLATALFLYYDEESLGYILVISAVFLIDGVPELSKWLLVAFLKSKPSLATDNVIGAIGSLSWYPAVPGIVLIVWDLIRRFLVALEQARTRRASLRYGQGVAGQIKRRNVFLGHCWNLPYCREPIRSRCPIFIKHKGPCWRYKQGCMCEESIAKLATTPGDWKSAVSSAISKMENKPSANAGGNPTGNPLLSFSDGAGRPQLSWGEKKQRCRECLIYNTHQEQKYKALSVAVFAFIGSVLYFGNGVLISALSAGFDKFNALLGQMALTGHGDKVFDQGATDPVCWFVLVVLAILLLSKLLQMVEYCCFTIKI
jgi:hypothetical protein